MPNHGGRYEIRDGKRVLVERTDGPRLDLQPQAPAKPAPKASPKPAKPAAKQPDDVKQEADHG